MTVKRKNFSPAKIGFLIGIGILYIAAWPLSTFAQTAALLPMAVQQFFDANAKPLSSGKVSFYIPGTLTSKMVWQDANQTVPWTQPITLNAAGRPPGDKGIYGNGTYRQIVKSSSNATIWDQLTAAVGTGGGSGSSVGDGNSVGTILAWSGMIAPNQYQFAYGQSLSRVTYPELLAATTLLTSITCVGGNPTLTGITDTSNIPIGANVEGNCIVAGSTVISKTINTVTLSIAANISTTSSARFFPYGNGNGTTTFNVVDLRGKVIPGRTNMGGVVSSNLNSTYYGSSPDAIGANGGGQSIALVQSNLPNVNFNVNIPSGQGSHNHSYTIANTSSSTLQPGGASIPYPISASANTGSTTLPALTGTAASGGSGTAFSLVQPSITLNYIIKVTPDTSVSGLFGVASIGGMQGIITCGANVICVGNDISVAVPSYTLLPPTPTTLGGLFSSTVTSSQFVTGIDLTGTITKAQPAFTDLSGSIVNSMVNASANIATSKSANTPSGTGAATVALSTILNDIAVDIVNYGADPTGVADSTTAVQNAINANSNLICNGTFKLNSTVTIPQSRRIKLSGSGNCKFVTANAISMFTFLRSSGATYMWMDGIWLEGTGGNNATGVNFHGTAGLNDQRIFFTNGHVRNLLRGFDLQYTGGTFDGITAYNNTILFYGERDASFIDAMNILHSGGSNTFYFTDPIADGISNSVALYNVKSVFMGLSDYVFIGYDYVTLTGGGADLGGSGTGAGQAAFYCELCTNSKVQNYYFSTTTTGPQVNRIGIQLVNSTNMVIAGNTVVNNARGLTTAGTTAGLNITNNDFRSNSLNHVYLTSTGGNVTVSQNQFDATPNRASTNFEVYASGIPYVNIINNRFLGTAYSPSVGSFSNTQMNSFSNQSSAVTASAAGSTGQVQINSGGSLAASTSFTWSSPTLTLGLAGSTTGTLALTGSTSGTISIKGQAAAGTYNFNLPTSAGSAGDCLKSGGGGAAAQTYGACGSGTPGGSTTQVQYNNAGAFGGITGATTNGTTLTLVAPILGTPASVTLTNGTGLPISGITGLGTNIGTFLATPSSANLASALTDETGTGFAVFSASPALTGTPTAPTASILTNTTQVATTAYVDNTTREKLSGARTYYVRTDGNDSNTCLVDSAGGGCLTVNGAIAKVKALDTNAQTVTIQIKDGTFTTPVVLENIVGATSAGQLVIQGNNTTPTNVSIATTTGNGFTSDGVRSIWDIKDLQITTSVAVGHGLATANGSLIRFGNLDFGPTNGNHIQSSTGGQISSLSNYTISGNASSHMYSEYAGSTVNVTGRTVTFTANAIFSTGFARTRVTGTIRGFSNTYTLGAFAATGARYNTAENGYIFTNQTSDTYFPGTTIGTTNSGSGYIDSTPQLFQTRVASDFSKTSDTTLANITGLTQSLAAGRAYGFRVILYTTSNVAGGIKAAISGTATATTIIYDSVTTQGGTVLTVGASRGTALDTTVGNITAATVGTIQINGTILVNAAGTLTAQFAQNVSNGTASIALAGSTMEVWKIQ